MDFKYKIFVNGQFYTKGSGYFNYLETLEDVMSLHNYTCNIDVEITAQNTLM